VKVKCVDDRSVSDSTIRKGSQKSKLLRGSMQPLHGEEIEELKSLRRLGA